MDVEFTKWLATLGIGGILAGFMFMFYRKDVKQYTELWRATTESLMSVIKENTGSNVKLIALLENQERNMMRKSDLITIMERRMKNMGKEARFMGERQTDETRYEKG